MGFALAKIKAVYDNAPMRSVFVPEWDLMIFYRPLKGDELDVIEAVTPKGCTPTRSNTQVVVTKALDANGVRLFKNDEADELYETAYPEVVNRLSTELWKAPSVAQAEKNSLANPD